MTVLDIVVLLSWLSPFVYFGLILLGKHYHNHKQRILNQTRNISKIILQIPTIGNVETTNSILAEVKDYGLATPIETWVVIEEKDNRKAEYEADRVIVVPKTFKCEDLYKARALEYVRRKRIEMVQEGSLEPDYLLLHCDDDSRPSKEFIEECLQIDSDVIIGSISPKPRGILSNILDYERPVACAVFCNFLTNSNNPVWAHGEGFCLSSNVDLTLSYDVSKIAPNNENCSKLVSSEDLVYLHKARAKGFSLYNSENSIHIVPPLNFRDAVKQRKRWLWGHLNAIRNKFLPPDIIMRFCFVEFQGLVMYPLATAGMVLHSLGLVTIPQVFLPVTWATLFLWFALRGYAIGKQMGVKHAIIGSLVSYLTVTLNFVVNIIGLVQGDPKRFEVIQKC